MQAHDRLNDDASVDAFGDALVGSDAAEQPRGFFDRFMFNMHPSAVDGEGISGPEVIVGAGVYPAKDTTDGFLICVLGEEQRNLRFSSELSACAKDTVGPFSWQVIEPARQWRLQVGPNPSGVELNALWTARAPAWSGTIRVTNADSETAFDHLFQSGRLTGTLRVDGVVSDLSGWFSQRDRSRGVRTMAGGQGLHLWMQPQFEHFSVGLLYVEGRDGAPLLLEGAVMHENGERDDLVEVAHDLRFTDELELDGGTVQLVTAAGRTLRLQAQSTGRGGYMAGAGYGGHHGATVGRDHMEHDRYPLDGTVNPRTADTALTDRLTAFNCGDERGVGIFEFAHSRSRSYQYRPTAGMRHR